MATSRKGSKVQSKIQMVLFGEPFTGKSTIALQLMYLKRPDGKPFRVLYIDAESGSVDDYLEGIESDGVDLDNLYIVYTQSLKETKELIRKATNREPFYLYDDEGEETDEVVLDADGKPFAPDAIVVDGTTVLNVATKQGLVEFSKKRAKVKAEREGLIGDEKFVKIEGASLELKDWSTISFSGNDLILSLTGSSLHYIVTARETDEKITKEINGKDVTVATGRKIPEGFKQMDYNAKTVCRMYREDGVVKMEVRKDRTGIWTEGEVVEDPTLLDCQKVIDKTSKYKKFVINNNLHEAIINEMKEVERDALHVYEDEEKRQEEVGSVPSVEALQSEISNRIKNFKTATEKAQAKQKLVEAGLPTNTKAVTDVEVLKKILQVLS